MTEPNPLTPFERDFLAGRSAERGFTPRGDDEEPKEPPTGPGAASPPAGETGED
ncbi:hypothetical protein GCM10027258_24230 [Amycolatopsis stemonae]